MKSLNKVYPNVIKLKKKAGKHLSFPAFFYVKGHTLDTIILAIIKRHSVTYSGGVLLSNNIKKSKILETSHEIKQNLEHHIHFITDQPEIFAQSPLDFSRNRKLSFETTLKIILSFGGQSLSS